MRNYGAETYGETIADVYDEMHPAAQLPDVTKTVDLLAELAHRGRALELGIGTGRVALPLRERGVEVHGIDASERMVAKLRAKPGGADLPVRFGDFIDVDVEGQFDLIFVVFNTFFGLISQEDQERCLSNVAKRLRPDGRFVMEAFVPDLSRFDRGQRVDAGAITADAARIDLSLHDPVNQTVSTQHLVFGPDGTRMYPVYLRYAWPSELDLMARLAGLRLQARYGGWAREPYTGTGAHVSVYARER